MCRPSTNEAVRLLVALLLGMASVVPFAPVRVYAQQQTAAEANNAARGGQLYKQSDLKGASVRLRVAVKENRDDVVAWNHQGEKETRKSLRQAADTRVKLFEKEFAAVSENITSANISHLEVLHQGAFDSVVNYLATGVELSDLRSWPDAFNNLSMQGKFLELVREALAQGKALRWSEVPRTRVRILKKALPLYTREARENQISGTITLAALFTADATIAGIRVVKGLEQSLTDEAIASARQIKFQPAMVGGRPVAQYLRIDYSFDINR